MTPLISHQLFSVALPLPHPCPYSSSSPFLPNRPTSTLLFDLIQTSENVRAGVTTPSAPSLRFWNSKGVGGSRTSMLLSRARRRCVLRLWEMATRSSRKWWRARACAGMPVWGRGGGFRMQLVVVLVVGGTGWEVLGCLLRILGGVWKLLGGELLLMLMKIGVAMSVGCVVVAVVVVVFFPAKQDPRVDPRADLRCRRHRHCNPLPYIFFSSTSNGLAPSPPQVSDSPSSCPPSPPPTPRSSLPSSHSTSRLHTSFSALPLDGVHRSSLSFPRSPSSVVAFGRRRGRCALHRRAEVSVVRRRSGPPVRGMRRSGGGRRWWGSALCGRDSAFIGRGSGGRGLGPSLQRRRKTVSRRERFRTRNPFRNRRRCFRYWGRRTCWVLNSSQRVSASG
jgi:hypothetical protein